MLPFCYLRPACVWVRHWRSSGPTLNLMRRTERSSGTSLFVKESKNARRHVSLTPRAQEVLVNRSLESKSEYVFANSAGDPYLVTSLDHIHKRLRDDLPLPNDCVIHSLRHAF